MSSPQLISANTGAAAEPLDWQDADGGPLEITGLPPFAPDAIRAQEWSLWRYAAMLPATRRFSLGEGMTPLVPAETPDGFLLAKLEYLNPTGSYKDRGTALLVNHLLAHGVTDAVEDSSGNAGASFAAYATAAGIRARIFAPASAPEAKKAQIRRFGAELVEVPGPRQATTDACLQAAAESVYASHAWNPFFIAGQMTCAWEIWEQMGRRAPDAILCPVGQGGLLLGLYRGFRTLEAAGLLDRFPRFYAAQSAGCDPVVRAFEQGLPEPAPVEPGESVADGIMVTQPVRGRAVMAAIYDSDGAAFRAGNGDIIQAQAMLAKRGLYAEPTSATAVAVLAAARAQMDSRAEFVVPLTGHGLKSKQ